VSGERAVFRPVTPVVCLEDTEALTQGERWVVGRNTALGEASALVRRPPCLSEVSHRDHAPVLDARQGTFVIPIASGELTLAPVACDELT